MSFKGNGKILIGSQTRPVKRLLLAPKGRSALLQGEAVCAADWWGGVEVNQPLIQHPVGVPFHFSTSCHLPLAPCGCSASLTEKAFISMSSPLSLAN